MALYYDYLWSRDASSNLNYAATGHSFGVWTPTATVALSGATATDLLKPVNITNVMTMRSNIVTIQGNVNVTGAITCATINGAVGGGGGSGGGSGGSGGATSNAADLTTGTLNKARLPTAFNVATDTQTIVITANSNVGIGTSTATDLLTVAGSTRTSSLIIDTVSASRVLVTDANNKCVSSSVTASDLGSLSGIAAQNTSLVNLLNNKQDTIKNLTPNVAIVSSGTGGLTTSGVSTTELGYLSGVTSPIQAQLSTPVMANKIINGDMRIDQRNNVTGVASGYCVDRFKISSSNVIASAGVTAKQVRLSAADQGSNGGLAYATAVTAAASNIPSSNLIMYFPFESWTGIADVVGVVQGLNMAIKNSSAVPTYSSGFNSQGSSICFTNSMTSSPASCLVYGTYTVPSNTAISASMYIKFSALPPSSGRYSYPVSFGTGNTPGLALVASYRTATTSDIYVTINGIGNTSSTIVTINTWYHVAMVYSPGISYTLYLNGAAAGSYNGTPNPVPASLINTGCITLGDGSPTQPAAGGFPFSGYIDELRVYNRALTSDEVSLLAGTYAPAYTVFQQPIEGYDIADLAWGTSSASPVTLSYYIKNNTANAQTFTLSINNGVSRCYLTNTPSLPANKWTYVTSTIPGDTTGSWNTDSNIGLNLSICLGANILAASTTSSTWATPPSLPLPLPYTSSNTQLFGGSPTNFLAAPGNSLYITGVQLQKGISATTFNMRSYASELVAAKRYYERMTVDNDLDFNWCQYASAGQNVMVPVQYTVQKRAMPTTVTLPTAITVYVNGVQDTSFAQFNLRNAGRCALSFVLQQKSTAGSLEWRPNAGTFFAIDAEL